MFFLVLKHCQISGTYCHSGDLWCHGFWSSIIRGDSQLLFSQKKMKITQTLLFSCFSRKSLKKKKNPKKSSTRKTELPNCLYLMFHFKLVLCFLKAWVSEVSQKHSIAADRHCIKFFILSAHRSKMLRLLLLWAPTPYRDKSRFLYSSSSPTGRRKGGGWGVRIWESQVRHHSPSQTSWVRHSVSQKKCFNNLCPGPPSIQAVRSETLRRQERCSVGRWVLTLLAI